MEIENDLKRAIVKHALVNAFRHEGKADVGAVLGKVLGENPELKQRVKELMSQIRSMVQEVNSLSIGKQTKKLQDEFPDAYAELFEKKEEIKTFPPLPDAEHGKVVTRFPPEPNGFPHIGHAKALFINYEYAKMYSGKFILRFDDTNPAAEKLEYYDAFSKGLEWLGIKPDTVKKTSDDMEIFYDYAKKLIKAGYLYVCQCDPETVKQNRGLAKECGHRNIPAEDALQRWERMFSEFEEGDAIVRFKGDMVAANTVMRDPTMFRIVDAEHPLKGTKYRVWPTYDFVAPIEDSKDGVTHALRAKEYELRDDLYYRMLEAAKLRKPKLVEFSRLSLRGTPVSKRKIKPLVEQGLVDGWSDPRLPTLLGLRRRGILPEAIKEFVTSLGVSKSESEPTWDLLEAVNRKLVDPIAKRYFFVPDPVPLEVVDAPALQLKLKLHPDKNLGERNVATGKEFLISAKDVEALKEGDTVRLMELFNIKISRKNGEVTGKFAGMEVTASSKKIQWVTKDSMPFTVKIPGPLYIDEVYNKDSLQIVKGLAESACKSLPIGEIIQFIRFGFCRVDAPQVCILAHK
ncbi:MAG: glutamate--tRNA ligase [Thaumarchaeota archaeon]|nr:glutamate--tRNA ligase [Nitrososphaerota archaeon]